MRTFIEMQAAVEENAARMKPATAVLVASDDREGLVAIQQAYDQKLVQPLLIGDEEKTRAICREIGLNLSAIRCIHEPNGIEACRRGVELCRGGDGDVLIKGQIKTADFFRPILNKDTGIKTQPVLSVNTVIELDILGRLVVLTDAGMLVKPNLKEKAAMIENASVCASRLCGRKPKAAVLCAVEVVNEAMPDTVDAALLAKMADRGQIKGAVVDGPLAMDNALSKQAAQIKGIQSEVAGDADILVVPDIEAGNMIVKTLTYVAGAANASYIHGARVPVLAPSRSDSSEIKFHSILLALYMAGNAQ